MSENPRGGRQARNFTTNVPKILDLNRLPNRYFSENCRWVPLKIESLNYRPLGGELGNEAGGRIGSESTKQNHHE